MKKDKQNLVVVIMAGGVGTRFWPLSTNRTPKQFLDLFGDRTMLQQSYDRVCDFVPPERILVAGDSGNDADMLVGETLGVVVANHTPELEGIKGQPKVFFANGKHAWGILDGIHHYDFFDTIRIPEEDTL